MSARPEQSIAVFVAIIVFVIINTILNIMIILMTKTISVAPSFLKAWDWYDHSLDGGGIKLG